MKIYNYHKETGEFIKESEARIDPLESKKQNKNIYLIPKFATDIKPPKAKKNEIAIFDSNKWILVADFRGNNYYLDNGTMIVIDQLDMIPPTDAINIKPPVDFINPSWDGKKWVENIPKAEGLINYWNNPTAIKDLINNASTIDDIKNILLKVLFDGE